MKQLSFLCCGNRRLGHQHPFPSQEGSLAGGVHARVSLRSLQFPRCARVCERENKPWEDFLGLMLRRGCKNKK